MVIIISALGLSGRQLMLFEIYDGANRVFCTDFKECIPSIDELKSMQKSNGYKFHYNGRKTSLKALQEVFK